MLQGALFAGSNRVFGFFGGAKMSEVSVPIVFEKSISKSAFLVFVFLDFGDPFSSAGTSGSAKEVFHHFQRKEKAEKGKPVNEHDEAY